MDSAGSKRAVSPDHPQSPPKRVSRSTAPGKCDFCSNAQVMRRTVPTRDGQEFQLCSTTISADCAGCLLCPRRVRRDDEPLTLLRACGMDQQRGLVCDRHHKCVATGPLHKPEDHECRGTLELLHSFDTAHWTAACEAHRAPCPACGLDRVRTAYYDWASGVPYCVEDEWSDGTEDICFHCALTWEGQKAKHDKRQARKAAASADE